MVTTVQKFDAADQARKVIESFLPDLIQKIKTGDDRDYLASAVLKLSKLTFKNSRKHLLPLVELGADFLTPDDKKLVSLFKSFFEVSKTNSFPYRQGAISFFERTFTKFSADEQTWILGKFYGACLTDPNISIRLRALESLLVLHQLEKDPQRMEKLLIDMANEILIVTRAKWFANQQYGALDHYFEFVDYQQRFVRIAFFPGVFKAMKHSGEFIALIETYLKAKSPLAEGRIVALTDEARITRETRPESADEKLRGIRDLLEKHRVFSRSMDGLLRLHILRCTYP